ncbi:MAG: hypothetical protein JXB10_13500 [Pirellulales bacterium]|nr:hypothetical protein [Pirellulales bacterium]
MLLCSLAGCASPVHSCWDLLPSELPFPCGPRLARKVPVGWPCYGYNPTCWSGWPIGCDMCPPPTSYTTPPLPVGSEPQIVPTPPALKNLESIKERDIESLDKENGKGIKERDIESLDEENGTSIKEMSLETLEPAPAPPPLSNSVLRRDRQEIIIVKKCSAKESVKR